MQTESGKIQHVSMCKKEACCQSMAQTLMQTDGIIKNPGTSSLVSHAK